MKNSKNEIMDILNRVADSGKEINVKVDNTNGVSFLLSVKQIEGGVEATISVGGRDGITIGGKCDLRWIANTIYSSIEW